MILSLDQESTQGKEPSHPHAASAELHFLLPCCPREPLGLHPAAT